jgi:hypothetical protein
MLPLRHAPAIEESAVAVEVLDAGEAIDDEKRVVDFVVSDAARINDLPRPGAGVAPDGFGLGAAAAGGEGDEGEGRNEGRSRKWKRSTNRATILLVTDSWTPTDP